MDLAEAIRFMNEWYPTDPDADEALNVLADEVESLRAAVERVREMHRPDGVPGHSGESYCAECHNLYPCPTVRALDGHKD